MSGPRRRVRGGRGAVSRRAALPLVAIVLGLQALLGAPAAGAATTLTPLLNCIQAGSGSSYTAVLGYQNPTRTTYVLYGSTNRLSPSSYDGDQPHRFDPGTHNGVYSLAVSSGTVTWTLRDTTLTISRTAAKACPSDTQLPAEGNGTGAVVALAIAAAVGALIVRRARRRAAAPSQNQESVDA